MPHNLRSFDPLNPVINQIKSGEEGGINLLCSLELLGLPGEATLRDLARLVRLTTSVAVETYLSAAVSLGNGPGKLASVRTHKCAYLPEPRSSSVCTLALFRALRAAAAA